MRSTDLIANDDLIDDRYRVISRLGSGASGAVYLAQDRELSVSVAVKVLRGVFADQSADARRQRFLREGKALAMLKHKGIVGIKRIALLPDGRPYLVMEFVRGESLAKLIASEGTLSCREATRICIDIAEALAHAHSQGIVHRDLKPHNIIIAKDATQMAARVLDFGLSSLDLNEEESKLTQTGVLLGTPAYMSPEQARGGVPDVRWDIYALGCVYFEMLSGRAPFGSGDPIATMWKQANLPVPKLSSLDPNAILPAELQEVIERTMAKDPANRYASCAEMLADLNATTLMTSTGRIDPAMVASIPEQPGEARPSWSWKPVIVPVVGILIAVIATASVLVASPTAAAGVTKFLSIHGSAANASSFSKAIASFDETILGPVAIDAMANQVLGSSELAQLRAQGRLSIAMGYLSAIGPGVNAERDWDVVYPTLHIALDCLRESDGWQSVEAHDALNKTTTAFLSGTLSQKHWNVLMKELEENFLHLKHFNTPDWKKTYYQLIELKVNSCELAEGPIEDRRAGGMVRWYLELAGYHANDVDDRLFERFVSAAENVVAKHPRILAKERDIHNTRALHFEAKGDRARAAAERKKADEVSDKLDQLQLFKMKNTNFEISKDRKPGQDGDQ